MNRWARRHLLSPKALCPVCKRGMKIEQGIEDVEGKPVHMVCAERRRKQILALLRAAKRIQDLEKEHG